jgi:AraC-like DNA-binding protein
VEYRYRPAGGALAEAVVGFWFVRGPSPSAHERILPMPRVHLVVNLVALPYTVEAPGDDGPRELPRWFCAGPGDRFVISGNPDPITNVGAMVRADALAAFAIDPAGAASTVSGIDPIGGADDWDPERAADVDPDAAIDRLEARLAGGLDPLWNADPAVRSSIRRLDEEPAVRIGSLATDAGLGHPAFDERFRRATGVTPKLYAELVRFHRLIDRLAAEPVPGAWSSFAADSGFYDQSHAIRAFRRFLGMTPSEYARRVAAVGPEAARFLPEASVARGR